NDELNRGKMSTWVDIIPEHPRDILEAVRVIRRDVMVVQYMRNVSAVVQLRHLQNGTLIQQLDIPPYGALTGIKCEPHQNECFFAFVSFQNPGIVYQLKLEDDDDEQDLS